MKQYDQPLAAMRRGDERSTVGERRPGIVAERRIRLGENLTGDGDVIGNRQAGKRTVARKPRQRLWFVPAQAAAENTAAAAQPDRHKVVLGCGKPRTREPH